MFCRRAVEGGMPVFCNWPPVRLLSCVVSSSERRRDIPQDGVFAYGVLRCTMSARSMIPWLVPDTFCRRGCQEHVEERVQIVEELGPGEPYPCLVSFGVLGHLQFHSGFLAGEVMPFFQNRLLEPSLLGCQCCQFHLN